MPRKGKQHTHKTRKGRRHSSRSTIFQTVYHTGKGAVKGMSIVALVSSVFLMMTSMFLLYQWKEFRIRQTLRDIEAFKRSIYELNTEIARKQSYIQRELLNPTRIARMARRYKNLQQSLETPQYLPVDKQKWQYFLEKDASQEN